MQYIQKEKMQFIRLVDKRFMNSNLFKTSVHENNINTRTVIAFSLTDSK